MYLDLDASEFIVWSLGPLSHEKFSPSFHVGLLYKSLELLIGNQVTDLKYRSKTTIDKTKVKTALLGYLIDVLLNTPTAVSRGHVH